MPDDMLKDAIETSRRIIQGVTDFEAEGRRSYGWSHFVSLVVVIQPFLLFVGLACAEKIKTEFDSRWSPYWHCIIGRNFGSFVTHETKNFIFFYLGDKAVMLFKAG